ncbi:tRNA 5-methylaminomethyl-2-thiouridine biosynthesis bifunctional protein [Rhodoferax saidenbachensis]|uniref:tRNA 5-methylaminomethyl-2-thiouridine biosynthesis bifunctional protein n=2 Tax=Rhodoferax saidenbachensis TaxID=1484693 RepID=A0ABU1ZI22_9BURK|nr:tRNA 5-methylaminomethyl-2-thiouridine biosynthesis bifunctional protein [Rhodoferax saidenbachensis]
MPSHLPGAWAGQAAWTVLDTHFAAGAAFLDCWQTWRSDPQRPRMLHYVGILSLSQLQALSIPHHASPATEDLARALADQCKDLDTGFHRLLLHGGLVSLTLCVGDAKPVLAELTFRANTVWVQPDATWDKWATKALARCCQRGAHLQWQTAPAHASAWLAEAGFVDAQGSTDLSAEFNPRWSLGPRDTEPANRTPAHCAIIGAGLSGASVAQALALRGWQVTVLDRHPAPAGGASGLPAGLVVPHISADDSPRSRMSRVGVRLMLHHARTLLAEGHDWQLTGVQELQRDTGTSLWHTQAAWIQPARLIQRWLDHPNIRYLGASSVAGIQWDGAAWQLHDTSGATLVQADVVVCANATGSVPLLVSQHTAPLLSTGLLQRLQSLQAVHGTISLGPTPQPLPAEWPAHPVNGHGSFIPDVPLDTGRSWLAGATFEPEAIPECAGPAIAPLAQQHQANAKKLSELLPAVGTWLAPEFDSGRVTHWSGTRCVTHDRLPLVGPLTEGAQSSLWMQVGMGARGLSFSALGAQLLVARLCGEPWPLEASLARSLDVARTGRRRGATRKPVSDD